MSKEPSDSLGGLQMQVKVDYTLPHRRDETLHPEGYGTYESTFDIQTEAAVEMSDKTLFEAVVKSKLLKEAGDALESGIVSAMETFSLNEVTPKRFIKAAPGNLLKSIAGSVLRKKTYERLVVQTILDEREEYYEALSEGREIKARWIAIRMWLLVICNLILTPCFSAAAKLFSRHPSL